MEVYWKRREKGQKRGRQRASWSLGARVTEEEEAGGGRGLAFMREHGECAWGCS